MPRARLGSRGTDCAPLEESLAKGSSSLQFSKAKDSELPRNFGENAAALPRPSWGRRQLGDDEGNETGDAQSETSSLRTNACD